jgi:SAM-dependent methyltransferase
MHSSDLFYRYYDVLFSSKDYAGEVAAILDHCASYPLQPLENVLEIGCGTGGHTLELAKMAGIHVTAIDVDPEMLALAHTKVELAGKTNISFASAIGSAKGIDLTVALFNVVNYLLADESLHEFFADIAASLRPQGMFIFDCWNGTAVLLDPPGSKSYEWQLDGIRVSCHLTSQTDVFRGITTLNYQLDLFDESDKKIESGDYRIEHRLWTPVQIRSALQEAGLEVVKVCIPFQFEQEATEGDWKIMFVCRKI